MNGETIQSGKFKDLDLDPQESKRVLVPLTELNMEPLNEYFLEIEFRLKEDKGLLKAGHLIAWEQLPIVNYATIKKHQQRIGKRV